MFFLLQRCNLQLIARYKVVEKCLSRLSFKKRAIFCVFFEDLFGNTLKYLYLCIVERKDRRAGH